MLKISIKSNIKKNKPKEHHRQIPNIDLYNISIQCPDCGQIFSIDKSGEYYCRRCNRIYLENEIRDRCGL